MPRRRRAAPAEEVATVRKKKSKEDHVISDSDEDLTLFDRFQREIQTMDQTTTWGIHVVVCYISAMAARHGFYWAPGSCGERDDGQGPVAPAPGAGGDPAEPVHGQPDMNTLHFILPKPSLPVLITERLTGSLLTRRVTSLKQESSSTAAQGAGRRPVIADEGNFINTMK
jgi:hypothetical protein